MNNVFLLHTGCSRKIAYEQYRYPMGDYTDNNKMCYHVHVYIYM